MRTVMLLVLAFASNVHAQVALVSSASPAVAVAPDSLATIFGNQLAAQTQAATSLPWPTSLGGVSSVDINAIAVPLLYVSPTQMNIWIPPGTATGPAVLSIPWLPGEKSPASARTYPVAIQNVAPGLFSLSGTGSGIAAASAVRYMNPTTTRQAPVPVFQCTPYACALVPIDVGLDTPVFLSLYGTGIRGVSSLSNVSVTIGNVTIAPTYAGPQPQIPGLDQVNVPLVLSLRGNGLVNVTVTADGITSNAVQILIQ